ncbi:AMP-dependent synthetase and ligase [Trichormus variabilis ATCC 29413]|uniref:AMP-dependent synthetase and ligase n=2 Tax=Anabaena variabilis TaxID=264691 RepID=Q3MCL4_TRIV2|nr:MULTISPECIES: fatty acyl-AMP ligase [Nostocaceae]ABA21272.1 AMP-dependent synthetase and ligase [Trichormus variabilis ATCC 29413]MBC1214235.1 fatty acyl-AMP ligase [Trichormus variabilis ARAD]MBC1254157.1 fatty acyl-AMP ligase [Trichormus variabilis V5]MBC1266339.1 fatty acyl-AMP ligase [Trichormus variabilis FSR]MBC1301045.1 fatty acyl-AMP ligase [Trichormus variabilis N2B]
MTNVSTLVELLRARATHEPDNLAYMFLIDGKTEGPKLTYAELDHLARAIGALLQKHNAKGERVLLLYPQGLDVMAAFLGSLYGGVIAIPAPPPDAGRLKRALPRLRAIVKDANAKFVFTNHHLLSVLQAAKLDFPEFEEMTWFASEDIDLELADQWQDPQITPDTLAYLQYTSGSTSTPKGVMISHHNIMHHCAYLQKACGYDAESVSITWMPYFHDYGLVEGLTVPIYNGHPCYVMSPMAFIKQPVRWLQAISRYRGTHSQAPNFAYEQCVRRVTDAQLATLNLSSWVAAGNAAEPINPRVLEEFFEKFAPSGFKWETFAPAYGLAENTLLVSTSPRNTPPVLCLVEKTKIEQNKIVEATTWDDGVRAIPGCGRLVCETQVAIVNPDTLTRCAADEVGEVWVADPSVAGGYWQRPQESESTFRAKITGNNEVSFLRTGDLGFIKGGELFITGRIKDLIIIRGTNHYPQDLEWTVQEIHPALRPDYGAAFSIDVDGVEQLVIVQEVKRKPEEEFNTDEVLTNIRQAIAEIHELQAYAVVLVKPGNVLKTSSGKIQRRACKASFLAGELEVLADWSENPKYTASYRRLQGEVDSLLEKVQVTH